MERRFALIDNKEVQYDLQGYVYGKDLTGRECRASYHSVIAGHAGEKRKNTKIIGSGHVYVLNYDKDSFVERPPMTYEEYSRTKTIG